MMDESVALACFSLFATVLREQFDKLSNVKRSCQRPNQMISTGCRSKVLREMIFA